VREARATDKDASTTTTPIAGTHVVDTTSRSLPEPEAAFGAVEAQDLLKRAPNSYLLNQIYGLWFFVSWFFLVLIITHTVSPEQYGVFAVALTAYNTLLYITALGLEDATTVYVPRLLVEHGAAAAALLIRRLLVIRIVLLLFFASALFFGIPLLATAIGSIPIKGATDFASGLRDPKLLAHIAPIALYIAGSGITNLLTALCAALMRMRLVLIISGLSQAAVLGVGFVVLRLGWGVDGMLWLLAISSLLGAAAFLLRLAPFIFMPGATYKQSLAPVIRLSISAWLTNLATGALLKQASIILLGYAAISLVQIGYFNLSFQLADAANTLLVAGFAGVGGAALAAAFIGDNYERLALSWRSLIKIETLLMAPVLVFCLFNAPNIVHMLYGSNFDAVGPLLAIFLFFNLLIRVLGTTIHQATMYVVGKPRLVVLSQWVGLLFVVVLGLLLIPRYGVAGALIADGVSRAITGTMQLFFLWPLPHKYPLAFTLRLLLALTLAALPSLLWHPANHILLALSATIFLLLCIGLLLLIKPLDTQDIGMIERVNPRMGKYLRWFAPQRK